MAFVCVLVRKYVACVSATHASPCLSRDVPISCPRVRNVQDKRPLAEMGHAVCCLFETVLDASNLLYF